MVLPSVGVGLTIGERLAREGQPWINLRFATTAQVAEGFVGPRLVAQGTGRLREEVGSAVIGRLLQGPGRFRRRVDS